MRFGRDVPLLIVGAIALALMLLAAFATQLYSQQSRAMEQATFAQLRAILEFNQPGDAPQDTDRILFQGGPAFELPLFGNGFE